MKLNKFTPRRFPCPGNCGRMIWKNYAPKSKFNGAGTFSYQVTQNRCRKCARRKYLAAAKLQRRQKQVTESVPENA